MSTAVQVTIVSPIGNISGALFSTAATSITSVATASPIATVAPSLLSASATISGGGERDGFSVSPIIII